MRISNKHRKFVELYCTGMDATSAYKEAFGCQRSTAKSGAYKMLKKPEIQAEMQKIQEDLWKKTRMNSVEVLALLAEIARGNTTDQVTQVLQNGKVIQAESRVSTKDRLQALQLIGKNMKMFTERVDMNANVKKDIKVNVMPMSMKDRKK